MRNRKQKDGITVNAIAGTYVVFLGLDLDAKRKRGFRGFAIKREDHNEEEETWLRGLKTFEATAPHPAPGETFSSLVHPIQGFQWSDYSAKAGYDYTYTIYAMYGPPSKLEARGEVSISVTTEIEEGKPHSVFFNRGSVATQEYARKFLNEKPKDVGPAAYEWLSRGLVESIINFIRSAKKGDSIHGAIYEFQWPDILTELGKASKKGVKIKILFDDINAAKGPRKMNRENIKNAGIKNICFSRAKGKLMHNKFFVLSRGKNPDKVLTGSTNLTENGIFGHSNLVHIVDDKTVAKSYLAYWNRLKEDPKVGADYRDANMEASPVPEELKSGTTTIYSPRGTALDSLDFYSKIAGETDKALLMTFAFGMHEKFKEVYRKKDNVLRMALMEKAFASPIVKERDEKDIAEIRKLPNTVVALGNRIPTNAFDRWLKELDRIIPKLHVYWIHTKYMIVDPLGKDPIIISGSANFSKASTDSNDENMLMIKGDKRIADIYFGEYMRLFNHYSFRESVKRALEREEIEDGDKWTPQFLDITDKWMNDYYNDTNDKTGRFTRKKYFSGPMSI